MPGFCRGDLKASISWPLLQTSRKRMGRNWCWCRDEYGSTGNWYDICHLGRLWDFKMTSNVWRHSTRSVLSHYTSSYLSWAVLLSEGEPGWACSVLRCKCCRSGVHFFCVPHRWFSSADMWGPGPRWGCSPGVEDHLMIGRVVMCTCGVAALP